MQNVVAVMFDNTQVGSPAAILRRSPGVYAGFRKVFQPCKSQGEPHGQSNSVSMDLEEMQNQRMSMELLYHRKYNRNLLTGCSRSQNS